MRTSYYNQLKRISPYLIYEHEIDSRFFGVFSWGSECINGLPAIQISPSAKNSALRTATLIHEIGHALHYKRGCKCFINKDRVLQELHADRFGLHFMLQHKFVMPLRFTIQHIKKRVYIPIYNDAANQLQKEKIWNKCLDFLGVKP